MNHSGAYTCLSCTNPLTTVGEGSTYCDGCVAGYFWDTPTWDLYGYPALAASYDPYNPRPYIAAQCADCCVECDEDGTSCDARGATLETLPLERRWWRASAYSDDVYECALDDACAGGSNASAYCATGHEGALCGICSDGFLFDKVKNRCVACGSPKWDIGASPSRVAGFCVVACVVAAVAVWYVRSRGKSATARSLAELATVLSAAADGAGELADNDAGDDDDDGDGGGDDGGGDATGATKYVVKLKILIGLYQITSSTQWSLPQVPFPRLLGLPFSVASFLDLDVLGLLPLDCIRKVTYFESLLFTTLAPIALGALIYGAATALEARATRGRAREIYATKSYLLLLLSFCVLTACASATASRGGDGF